MSWLDNATIKTVANKQAEAQQQLVNEADAHVQAELAYADRQVQYHTESSSRATLTIEQWYAYKESLRDYVQVIDGVRNIATDKPERPV